MTIINQNSISGITSITAASGSVQIFNSDGSSGSLTDLAGINVAGVVTATSFVGDGINVAGVVTATSFVGDGSNLTGIDATQIVTGNTSVQTVDTGSDGHIKFNTEGSEVARFDSSGRFGVGTASPRNALHALSSNGDIRIDTSTNGGAAGLIFDVPASNGLRASGHRAKIQCEHTGSGWDSNLIFYGGNTSTEPSEQLRITSDNYLRMASGTNGIQFGGDTAAANALDDYEEGTWTPVLTGDLGGSGQTYSQQTGYYTKVGRLVNVAVEINLTNKGTITRYPIITGMPFNRISSDAQRTMAVVYFANMAASVYNVFVQHEGNNSAYFYKVTGTATTLALFASGGGDIANNSRFILTWSYQASS